MKIAIVGSRRRDTGFDSDLVGDIVRFCIGNNHEIVSGACPLGADNFAARHCMAWSYPITEFPVPKIKYSSRWAFAQAAYARNRLIAEACDICFALVSDDRTGGTESTISYCIDLNKPIYLVSSTGSCIRISSHEKKAHEVGDLQAALQLVAGNQNI